MTRARLVGVLTVTLVSLALPAAASALSGKAIQAGTPGTNNPPRVAVDSSGTALIVWVDSQELNGAPDIVQYCVLPAGASACAHTGNLTGADSAKYIDGVNVEIVGSTWVILADVYGTSTPDAVPEQEWQSTDGGATWNLVNGGLSVSDGIENADTGPLNSVIVPGTNELGFGWVTAGGPPTFNAFPLDQTQECSTVMCNGSPSNTGSPPPHPFAELQPSTQVQLGNLGGVLASQLGTYPGVLGVYQTLGANLAGPPYACLNEDTLAYAYGSGAQSASNSYNISPGSPGSAWVVPLSKGICNAQYPAVAGGPAGFGVLAENESNGATDYWPFDQTHQDFDVPTSLVSTQHGPYAALAQDAAGGIYAVYSNGGPIGLSYSATHGGSWLGPVDLQANANGQESHFTGAVGSNGQGWAAWTDNGGVFAQPFVASDTASTEGSVSSKTSATSTAVTVYVTCTTYPCTVTVTITITHAARDLASAARSKPFASGTFTIRRHGRVALTLKLSHKARGLLAAHHAGLTARMTVRLKAMGIVDVITKMVKIKAKR